MSYKNRRGRPTSVALSTVSSSSKTHLDDHFQKFKSPSSRMKSKPPAPKLRPKHPVDDEAFAKMFPQLAGVPVAAMLKQLLDEGVMDGTSENLEQENVLFSAPKPLARTESKKARRKSKPKKKPQIRRQRQNQNSTPFQVQDKHPQPPSLPLNPVVSRPLNSQSTSNPLLQNIQSQIYWMDMKRKTGAKTTVKTRHEQSSDSDNESGTSLHTKERGTPPVEAEDDQMALLASLESSRRRKRQLQRQQEQAENRDMMKLNEDAEKNTNMFLANYLVQGWKADSKEGGEECKQEKRKRPQVQQQQQQQQQQLLQQRREQELDDVDEVIRECARVLDILAPSKTDADAGMKKEREEEARGGEASGEEEEKEDEEDEEDEEEEEEEEGNDTYADDQVNNEDANQ